MNLTDDLMLERFLARDRSYDGRFVTGVVTTGIYCLPSCSARKPRPENVRFFATEDEARASGLRPCRRCRPDHFYREYDPGLHLVETLAADVRREPGRFPDVADLVTSSGVGATKLHALFRQHFHATPATFLARERVAAACRLLETGDATATEAGFAAGYESISAFHEGFRRWTGLTPGEYRRLGAAPEFTLSLPADYLGAYTLRLLGRDPASATERVVGNEVAKGVHLADGPATLRIRLDNARAHVRVDALRTPAADEVREAHAFAVRLLGLAWDPAPFERRLRERPELERLVEGRRGLRVPLTPTVWEGVVWAVVGQQVNLAFAYALRRDLALLAGADAGSGLRAHPTVAAVAALDYADLAPLRFSRRKAEYVVDAARSVVAGELPLESLPARTATTAERTLRGVRGFGPWSARYVLMRSCGFADCVPVGDAGLVVALQRFFGLPERPDPDGTVAAMEPFAPFRTLATHHLWMTLGDPA